MLGRMCSVVGACSHHTKRRAWQLYQLLYLEKSLKGILRLLQVVLMNHVTTKVLDNNRGSKLVPALGWYSSAGSMKCSLQDGLTSKRVGLSDCRRQLGSCRNK